MLVKIDCVQRHVLLESFLNTLGTEDDTVDQSPPVAGDSYERSSPDVQQQDVSPSSQATAAEDTQYAATRKRRLLLMDEDSDDEET